MSFNCTLARVAGLLIVLALTLAVPAFADPITVDLGVLTLDMRDESHEWRVDFHDLNGTRIGGQLQSLTVLFSTPSSPPPYLWYYAVMIWRTDYGAFPGFMQPGTGYLLGRDGVRVTPVMGLGRASGDDGSLAAGVIASGEEVTGEVGGAHFDVAFPDLTGYKVTDATMVIVAQSVPEPGSAWDLAIGLALVTAFRASSSAFRGCRPPNDKIREWNAVR